MRNFNSITPDEEQKIISNFDKFVKIVEKMKDEELRDSLLELTHSVSDRLAVAPASTRHEYHGAFPGGLVHTSIEVGKIMKELNQVYSGSFSKDDIIVCALFHAIGKIGDEKEDLYYFNESDWHRERGMVYEFNKNLAGVPTAIRSIWWVNKFAKTLTIEQTNAILSLATLGKVDQNSNQLYGADLLTVALQNAVRVAAIKGSGITTILDT